MNESLPADQKFGECPRNPRNTGHCEHTEFQKTTAGDFFITRCCWCGRVHQTRMNVPEHGTYV